MPIYRAPTTAESGARRPRYADQINIPPEEYTFHYRPGYALIAAASTIEVYANKHEDPASDVRSLPSQEMAATGITIPDPVPDDSDSDDSDSDDSDDEDDDEGGDGGKEA